jgi:hypothetical protein
MWRAYDPCAYAVVEVPPSCGRDTPYGDSVTNDDLKAKMREALEKKQDAKHASADGADGSDKVHGPEVTGPGKRVHRRKSG